MGSPGRKGSTWEREQETSSLGREQGEGEHSWHKIKFSVFQVLKEERCCASYLSISDSNLQRHYIFKDRKHSRSNVFLNNGREGKNPSERPDPEMTKCLWRRTRPCLWPKEMCGRDGCSRPASTGSSFTGNPRSAALLGLAWFKAQRSQSRCAECLSVFRRAVTLRRKRLTGGWDSVQATEPQEPWMQQSSTESLHFSAAT